MSADGWKYMPGQPKVCAVCGKRVTLKAEAVWFQCSEPKQTWHFRCRPKVKR